MRWRVRRLIRSIKKKYSNTDVTMEALMFSSKLLGIAVVAAVILNLIYGWL